MSFYKVEKSSSSLLKREEVGSFKIDIQLTTGFPPILSTRIVDVTGVVTAQSSKSAMIPVVDDSKTIYRVEYVYDGVSWEAPESANSTSNVVESFYTIGTSSDYYAMIRTSSGNLTGKNDYVRYNIKRYPTYIAVSAGSASLTDESNKGAYALFKVYKYSYE